MMEKFQRLKGLVAATFTPMYQDGSINYSEIQKYAQLIVNSRINAVFICGTTGEFSSLTVDEREKILETWIEESKGRFKVIAHVGSNCQSESITLAKHAQSSGADAIASIAPHFFKPDTTRELIDFFKPIAESASKLPFYYYNMPSMTGVDLPVDVFLTEGKKEIPNLVGTKYTHNNLMEMGICLSLNDGEFEVLNGFDETLIGGLAMGVVAGVGSTYNYLPTVYSELIEAMSRGEIEKAREYQMEAIEIVKIIIRYGGGVRGGKAIMNLIGINCGNCRLPIKAFSEKEYSSLRNDLNNTSSFANLKM